MEHLFPVWDSAKDDLQKKYVYLFLDCDGTLAPIADMPDKASIPQKTKEVLVSLSKVNRLKLAIISGRALSDVKAVVGLDGIVYVGNHGLEMEGPGLGSGWKMNPTYKSSLAEIKDRLTRDFAAVPGVFVEDKGLSLCLHYRMAGIDEEKVNAIFSGITDPYKAAGTIGTMYGKKVIEVRPTKGWDKGKIVKWLLAREHLLFQSESVLAIYVGDDQTDEDAFKALGNSEMTIVVGKAVASAAKYYVNDTEQVYEFLTMLLALRNGQHGQIAKNA